MLVLGIGGSSLGGRALVEGLGPAVPDPQARRIHYPDNSDPWRLDGLLRSLEPNETLVLVISKSGGTVETAAQLLVVREWLRDGDAPMQDHLVAITDPHKGLLRQLADDEGLRSFDIPSNVGGRFSVLTPVGLLPGALAGLPVRGLLEGAKAMRERCARTELRENPAGMMAALHVLHHRLHDRPIHVMMPYADALRGYANWFVQLWAESLGKRRRSAGSRGGDRPHPAARGGGRPTSTRRSSSSWRGPRDKLITFVALTEPLARRTIPTEEGPYAYLGGTDLAELLDYERRATRPGPRRRRPPEPDRPTWPRLDAHDPGRGSSFSWRPRPRWRASCTGSTPSTSPASSWASGSPTASWVARATRDAASEVQALEKGLPPHRV